MRVVFSTLLPPTSQWIVLDKDVCVGKDPYLVVQQVRKFLSAAVLYEHYKEIPVTDLTDSTGAPLSLQRIIITNDKYNM